MTFLKRWKALTKAIYKSKESNESSKSSSSYTDSSSPTSTETSALQSSSQEEDYDPHKHRNVQKGTTAWESFLHLIKCAFGTGMLAMPQGFSRVGMLTGVLIIVVCGIIVTHCLHLVVRSSYLQCKRLKVPVLSYRDAMTAAMKFGPRRVRPFANCLGLSTDIFLVVFELGVCCVYVIFIAQSIKKLTDPHLVFSIYYHMIIVIIPLIALNLIPSLKILAPLSAVANLLTLVALAAIIYFAFTADRPDNSDLIIVSSNISEIPLFLGTALFATTAVGVVIAVEMNMKNPMQFRGTFGVFNCAMAIIIIIYASIGAIGYQFCRGACADSITLNTPQNVWLADLVVIAYALAILFSYALHCFVPVEIIMEIWKKNQTGVITERRELFFNYCVRIGLAFLTFALAMAIPKLALFISLFGALCMPALAVFFPVMMEAVDTKNKMVWCKDFLIFCIGVVAMVAGTFSACNTIIRELLFYDIDLT